MKDDKKLEVLLKIILRTYGKNPGMQQVLEAWMIEVRAKKDMPPEQVFFILQQCQQQSGSNIYNSLIGGNYQSIK